MPYMTENDLSFENQLLTCSWILIEAWHLTVEYQATMCDGDAHQYLEFVRPTK